MREVPGIATNAGCAGLSTTGPQHGRSVVDRLKDAWRSRASKARNSSVPPETQELGINPRPPLVGRASLTELLLLGNAKRDRMPSFGDVRCRGSRLGGCLALRPSRQGEGILTHGDAVSRPHAECRSTYAVRVTTISHLGDSTSSAAGTEELSPVRYKGWIKPAEEERYDNLWVGPCGSVFP